MSDHKQKPLVFISYSHKDEPEKLSEGEVKWLSFVQTFLGPAEKNDTLELWIDRHMLGGADWDPEIEMKLRLCQVFILLVSSNSMASDYIVGKEIAIIRERQRLGEPVYFYPILITPTPKAGLDKVRDKNLRPLDGRPLSSLSYSDRCQAMSDAADEIEAVVLALPQPPSQRFNMLRSSEEASKAEEQFRANTDALRKADLCTGSYYEICNRASLAPNEAFDIFTVSAHNEDVIYKVDRLAPDYETQIRNPDRSPGGSGANTAFALAQLGGVRVGVAGVIANDGRGQRLRASLQSVGINTNKLHIEQSIGDCFTGKTIVFSDRDGRRSIFLEQGVNGIFKQVSIRRSIDYKYELSKSRVVHISSFGSEDEKVFCEEMALGLSRDSLLTFTPGSLYSKRGLNYIEGFLKRTNIVFLYQDQLESLMFSPRAARVEDVEKLIENFYSWRASRGHNEPIILSVKRQSKLGPLPARDYCLIAYGKEGVEGVITPEPAENLPLENFSASFQLGAGDALAAGVIFAVIAGLSPQAAANSGYLFATFASTSVDARTGLSSHANFLREGIASIRRKDIASAGL
ncbi:PfkB family carbohydrate kinase [Methylobacterium frigidaeris]|uniref:Ribokinase n=1 Tax=Methylobacterium frigidaeris TaxID=2038277 RepID=A0AA37M8H4_9HYPH|nr:PfkB family carbohydrate kinase [Methylobacterium frigidaeris]GJD66713.1 Ribokinase [Methylobacterium frigidaeris]